MPPETGRLFCFGLGYTAVRLARRLRTDGWSVSGTCRGADKRRALEAEGIAALIFDSANAPAGIAAALGPATHVLVSIPPDETGDPVVARLADAIAAAPDLRWLGYLSTTGVYGDRDGGWVDEDCELRPTGPAGRRRVAAETAWQALHRQRGVPVHVFRLAGIYGPGRSALDQIRAGTARRIVKPGHAFSRIHVDDAVAVLAASMARPDAGAIYNVCDDMPAPAGDVVAHGCELLGVAAPPETPFASAVLSDMARGFYADNKRVRNDRVKRELGIALRFPDYRSGLAALAAKPR